MKSISKYLLSAFTLIVVLASCEKDEHKVYLESSKEPVLTASTTSAMVLTAANSNNPAIKFSWTNPDYKFTTGISSQDVTYVLP